ncbi:hypothetical protein [Virgibacillus dakarensis]|uniref:hypothetical protein n=1 Tax=Virgibacillus dakarensis TaxID=1917889 RepID=UPI0013566CEA|nr:hypothetical protein [Virgibacillus dakarensis]
MECHEIELWQGVQALLTVNQWKWVKYSIVIVLSNQEIAELEDVSIAAVYSWAKTAKRKLKMEWGKLELLYDLSRMRRAG